MNNNIINASDADFDSQVLTSDVPVLVDFWAEWCGPCRMIAPMIDELASTYAGRVKVVKVNVDNSRQTAARYSIRGIPTLMMFKDGKVEATQVGAVTKTQLTEMIENAS